MTEGFWLSEAQFGGWCCICPMTRGAFRASMTGG